MFRVILAHPQKALKKLHLVYCVRVISVGCTTVKVELYLTSKISYLSVISGRFDTEEVSLFFLIFKIRRDYGVRFRYTITVSISLLEFRSYSYGFSTFTGGLLGSSAALQ
jgi:hypothetical protein